MRGIFELALAATSVFKRQADAPACATSLHMIVARGSNEPAGLGRITAVVGNVTLLLPGSDYEAIDYPADLFNYVESVAKGTDEFVKLVGEYHTTCPDTPIALLGYSQGAHALMDAVCGTDLEGFEMQADLPSTYLSSIVAVVIVGDPSHVADAPWDVGTSVKDGFFPRTNLTACEPYSPLIRSWCDTGDTFCDSGSDETIHGSYFRKYSQDAAKFVIDNYKKAIENKSSTTSTTVAPGTSSTASPGVSTTAPSDPSTTSTAPANTSVPAGGSVIGPSVFVLVAGMVLSLLV